jgi:peroxiredoxin
VTSTKRAAPPSSTQTPKETDMSLQAKLDAFKADFEAGKPPYSVPRPVIETMHRATAELIESGAAKRAKKAGDLAPSFSLKDPEGNIVSSADLLTRGPLVLSFYRGVWCPYCNMELQALESVKPEFDKYGASLVAISPQTAPNSRKSVRQNKLSFPILSDAKGKVGAAFGLRFNLPDYLVELYKAAQERSADVQRRPELDAADAGPLRHRTGRRHPLFRSEPRLHSPAGA